MKDKGTLLVLLIVVILGASIAGVFGIPMLSKIFKKPGAGPTTAT